MTTPVMSSPSSSTASGTTASAACALPFSIPQTHSGDKHILITTSPLHRHTPLLPISLLLRQSYNPHHYKSAQAALPSLIPQTRSGGRHIFITTSLLHQHSHLPLLHYITNPLGAPSYIHAGPCSTPTTITSLYISQLPPEEHAHHQQPCAI